jgi:glycine/D-amino acid oxidase-like deaminating enzyme
LWPGDNLHPEAGYIYADCNFAPNNLPLHSDGGPYIRDPGDNLLLVGGFTNYYRVTDIHTLFSNNDNSVAVIVVIPIAFRMPAMLVFIPPSMTHIPAALPRFV